MERRAVGIALALVALAGRARGEDLRPALTVRAVRPDRQLERVLALFRGTRATSPAAALAGWRRATGRHLSKPAEAAIAAFNPEMVREMATLDGAEAVFAFDPVDGSLRWRARAPRDDGTLAALATALALTGGGADEPLGGAAVDRLGPSGAPLVARSERGLVAAGSREELGLALKAGGRGKDQTDATESGWIIRVDPRALDAPGSLDRRRLAEALRAIGCDRLDGVAGLDGSMFSLIVTGHFDAAPPGGGAIEPAWLDCVPRAKTLAAAAWAIEPGREFWDAAFTLLDRVEKVDPARAKAAPVRARLDLIALAAGARPEIDVWPKLRGITVAVRSAASGAIDGGLLALHAIDGPAAERLVSVVLPKLARASRLARSEPPREVGDVRSLGKLAGRPLAASRRGPTVLIGWGEGTLADGLDALENPGRSAGPTIRAAWAGAALQRAGALWPGRLGGLDERLAVTLEEGPPVLWAGVRDRGTTRDEIRWGGLDEAVRRFLDRLPIEPIN